MNSVPAAPPTDALTRVVAGFLVVILLDATQLLEFYPDRTQTLWAWNIQPGLTAMALGSVYLAGGYFFARVLFGAPWPRVVTGFPSVILFVWMAAIATILHFDRFIKDSLPFAAWAAIYVVTPVAVPLLYLRNRRRWGGPVGPVLPAGLRLALGAVGAPVVSAGLLFLVVPDAAIDVWPWSLTPLTARVTGAIVALYGSLWLTAALEGTATSVRIPFQAHALGLTCLLVAVARGSDVVDWDKPLAIVFVALAGTMLAVGTMVSWRAA
jgi:hypothetical protein